MRGKAIYGKDGVTYILDGKTVSKKEFLKDGKIKTIFDAGKMNSQSTRWPRISEAVTVTPEGAMNAQQASEKLGVPTRFVTRGDDAAHAVFESKAHMREYYKAFNLFDRDAGYNDVTPGTTRNGGNVA